MASDYMNELAYEVSGAAASVTEAVHDRTGHHDYWIRVATLAAPHQQWKEPPMKTNPEEYLYADQISPAKVVAMKPILSPDLADAAPMLETYADSVKASLLERVWI